MTDKERHLIEYSILSTASILFLFLFFYLRFEKNLLVILTATASFFYTIWGIVHHAFESRLTKAIAAEYVVFGLLFFVLIFTVLTM